MKEMRKKYYGFVAKYGVSGKICMTTIIEQKYTEEFFNDAVKDGILIEIERNDEGKRQFIFTKIANELL